MNQRDNQEKQTWMWHRRLGHPSFGYIKTVFPNLFLSVQESQFKCEACLSAKSHRVSFHPSTTRCQKPFALVHSDVWGPAPVEIHSGIKWFVLFVDDYTRVTWLYVMKNKSEVFSVFRCFRKMVETQYSAKIQILRTDNGGEYSSNEFQEYIKMHGMIQETSCPQTPQQNGIAERKDRKSTRLNSSHSGESRMPSSA